MDDDEDFRALFFSEARELLETLVEQLNLLADGAGEEDTVHAAFRAVHSVKGGAAAFGFDTLTGFAHIFETVMDMVRSDKLKLTADLNNILLRSGDMMQVLVENAEAGTNGPAEGMEKLQAELHRISGAEGGDETAAAEGADPDNSVAPEVSDTEEGVTSEYVFRFSPDEAFIEAGHDMLRMIRSARDLGLVEVHAEGSVPPLDAFDTRNSKLSWELVFRTEKTLSQIRAFFTIYEHLAQIECISGDEDGEDEGLLQGSEVLEEPDPAPAEPSAANDTEPAAEETGQTSAAATAAPRSEITKSLRVEISRIDRLVNLVGEMLITQAALAQQAHDLEGRDASDMGLAVDTMSRQLRELQESVMAIRAQPVKSVFRRMPRVVRDLSDKLDKKVRIDLRGEHTEVDATVIEELAEPLTHMIRNAMDHGLEENDEREELGKPRIGVIRLSAEHKGERVIITVEDDGRGINRERVLAKAVERGLITSDDQLSPEEIDMLIFHPGFSTAEEVSSVSGRGVGMDVVKKKIQALGGRFAMVSTPGQGTRFVVTLPLTLAVMDGMTIAVGDQKYILPLSTVVEALHVTREGGKTLPDGSALLERRGEYLRVLSLREALNLPPRKCQTEMAIVVDTEIAGHVALTVDELIGQRQIVLKSLEANFKKVDGISGATILGDGQVALILDVPSLMKLDTTSRNLSEVMH